MCNENRSPYTYLTYRGGDEIKRRNCRQTHRHSGFTAPTCPHTGRVAERAEHAWQGSSNAQRTHCPRHMSELRFTVPSGAARLSSCFRACSYITFCCRFCRLKLASMFACLPHRYIHHVSRPDPKFRFRVNRHRRSRDAPQKATGFQVLNWNSCLHLAALALQIGSCKVEVVRLFCVCLDY